MNRQERSETSEIIERTREELRAALQGVWNRLHWEPEIETPLGSVKGVLINKIRDGSELVYVSSSGRILRESEYESEEVNLEAYRYLAPKAENILKKLRAAQWQEIENDPEGRDVLWRPGQYLLGKWYCPYEPFEIGTTDRVITVRAKKDGLYCPEHPNQALITVIVPSEDRKKFTKCPEDNCHFSVFNGT